VVLKTNDVLFVEGDAGDTAYIVREGRLRLMKRIDGRERQVGVATRGELVGEMGLLCGLSRLVTAVAATPVVVLPLPKPLFEDMVSAEDRRGALLEVTNRLLQLQVYATGGEVDAQATRATLDVQWVAVRGWRARAYPLVRADAPALSDTFAASGQYGGWPRCCADLRLERRG
jgi:CRP-like cAMP-binding protein